MVHEAIRQRAGRSLPILMRRACAICGNGGTARHAFRCSQSSTRPILNDPQTGWFKSPGLAKILKLRVYGATRPGLLCTVEVTAGAGQASRVTKTVSVEFGAYAVPALHAPLQSGAVGHQPVEANPGVVSAHWGGDRSWIGSFPKAKRDAGAKRSRTGDGAGL